MDRRRFNQLMVGAALGQASSAMCAEAPAAMKAGATGSSRFKGRFSVMLWTIDDKLPVERCIDIAGAAGYNGVELVGEYRSWSATETRQIKAQLHSLGLVVDAMSGIDAGFADPNGSAELVAGFTKLLPYAGNLECSRIILLSGRRIEGVAKQIQHQACIDNLKRIADLASRADIEVLIEPIDLLENPTGYLSSVTEGFEIVRAVGSQNLKVLYDFYHEQRGYGNLIEKLDANLDWIGLVHVADVPGRHEPGTGEIDYRNIYRRLAELNYDRFVAMEYYPTIDPLVSLQTARMAAVRATHTKPAPYAGTT